MVLVFFSVNISASDLLMSILVGEGFMRAVPQFLSPFRSGATPRSCWGKAEVELHSALYVEIFTCSILAATL